MELLAGRHDAGKPNDSSSKGANASNGVSSGGVTLNRLLEESWPIGEHLKNSNADSLFAWIGQGMASVVAKGCTEWGFDRNTVLPMGVTFSFPMKQRSISEASLLSMGKGFAITPGSDLGSQLLKGYEVHRGQLPRITIAAIANDAVATLVSFVYRFPADSNQKAVMGLICGTGSNATIPLRLSSLREDKRPSAVSIVPGEGGEHVKTVVNTEWSINGSAPPLRKLGLISRWDTELDEAGEVVGFQPLEYMTSGRYLGELGRIILVDYITTVLGYTKAELPPKLKCRFGLNTTFLSSYGPRGRGTLADQIENAFPLENEKSSFQWTDDMAEALYAIALAIGTRAAGIVAAATIGLLTCAEDIPPSGTRRGSTDDDPLELVVGYTGGCIAKFQDYLADCQKFLDIVIGLEFGDKPPVRVLLSPCHDGGITGAGILVPSSLSSESA